MKRVVIYVLCMLLSVSLIASLFACGGSEGEPIIWSELILGDKLPTPTGKEGRVSANRDSHLSVDIHNSDNAAYSNYVKACKDMGYTVDAENIGSSYYAYNDSGYKLGLYYSEYSEEISISLDAPRTMKSIRWPFCQLAELLPAPESDQAEISTEKESKFQIYVGDTSRDAYDAYVQSCQEYGFTVDYDKGNDYYRAANADGYSLSLEYVGFYTMMIKLEAPAEETVSPTVSTEPTEQQKPEGTTAPTEPEETEGKEALVDGLRPEFKKAMDEYEEFYEDYAAFMKKYNASGGTDLSMLTDYMNFMSQSLEVSAAFEAWNSEDMNDAELAYFLEVQTRVNKMLLDVAM